MMISDNVLTDIQIRNAELHDAIELSELMSQLGYPITEEDMKDRIHLYLNHPINKAWVAYEKETVLGCVAIDVADNFHRVNRFCRIIALVIDTKYRRRGVGRALIQCVEDYAMRIGCSYVELTMGIYRREIGYHNFYQALGYEEIGSIKKYFAKQFSLKE